MAPTAWVGITDRDWFNVLAGSRNVDEVNFWQPSPTSFKALGPGEPFLFKLHSPLNYIVGGGFFAYWTRFPLSLAWDAFGEKNGALTEEQMRARIERYRRARAAQFENYEIGCILLEEPFFFPEQDWIPVPADWHPSIQVGKTYNLAEEPGRSLWSNIVMRLQARTPSHTTTSMSTEQAPRYGEAIIVRPRLGQGSFRLLVTDAYRRRCAITGEKVLPVLQAAHIRPFADGGSIGWITDSFCEAISTRCSTGVT